MDWKQKLKDGKKLAGQAFTTAVEKVTALDDKLEGGKVKIVNAIEDKLATIGRDKRKKDGDTPKTPGA
ncbi:MAG: hypothetical protein K0R10_1102 [Alphaproteobacteria bacterium]|jgi:hypothetical protein|nr:hypothetical protein [Alphaproteobacteria bacterium]